MQTKRAQGRTAEGHFLDEGKGTLEPHPPSMVKLILWLLLWLTMWCWAIAGPLCVVLAAVSFFVDLSPVVSISLFGQPVRTTEQKIALVALGAALSFVGLGFLWLRCRGYLKDPV
jgi:hypothetical protein